MKKQTMSTPIKHDVLVRYEDGKKELINCVNNKNLLEIIKSVVIDDINCKGAIITKSTSASKATQTYQKVKRVFVDGQKRSIAHA